VQFNVSQNVGLLIGHELPTAIIHIQSDIQIFFYFDPTNYSQELPV
jgi:hypothetical protein